MRKVPTKKSDAAPGEEIILNTREAARHACVSTKFLEKLRCVGGGPAYLRLSSGLIRYRLAALNAWLRSKERTSTSETDSAA